MQRADSLLGTLYRKGFTPRHKRAYRLTERNEETGFTWSFPQSLSKPQHTTEQPDGRCHLEARDPLWGDAVGCVVVLEACPHCHPLLQLTCLETRKQQLALEAGYASYNRHQQNKCLVLCIFNFPASEAEQETEMDTVCLSIICGEQHIGNVILRPLNALLCLNRIKQKKL